MSDRDVKLGDRYGIRWMSTWPHISLGVSAHIDRKFGHLSLHLPVGVVILGYLGADDGPQGTTARELGDTPGDQP